MLLQTHYQYDTINSQDNYAYKNAVEKIVLHTAEIPVYGKCQHQTT
jgi:hypothetical protein